MARGKRKGQRPQSLPDYVKTASDRETSLLASHPAVLKSMTARRGLPIIVPDTVKVFGMRRLSVKELEELRIDTRYQRDEITTEVNELVVVLKSGGIVPDPISVVERQYGDGGLYIVDGQQRWWAHVDTSTPINAMIYRVRSFEDEVTLFHALNNSTRVMAETRLRSLPGPAGETIRRLNEGENSPLRGRISFQSGSALVGAMILLRGLTALLSNTKPSGSIDRIASAFDRYYRMHPKVADRMCDQYAQLMAEVFVGEARLRYVPSIAFGRLAYAAWTTDPANMPLPKPAQIARLRKVDWERITPSHSMVWLPTVVAVIQEIWPVQLIPNEKDK